MCSSPPPCRRGLDFGSPHRGQRALMPTIEIAPTATIVASAPVFTLSGIVAMSNPVAQIFSNAKLLGSRGSLVGTRFTFLALNATAAMKIPAMPSRQVKSSRDTGGFCGSSCA